MLLIGITGGIGSGKTHVCSFIKDLGFEVYNSDIRAKTIVHRPEIRRRIKKLLGKEAYIKNHYNSKYIANLVFNNENLLNELNQIIHPYVQKDFHTFVTEKSQRGDRLIFKESALLVETKAFLKLNKLILVTAPIEVRKARVLKRKGMNNSKFEAILTQQSDDKTKRSFADLEIENDEKNSFLFELTNYLNKLTTN